MYKITPFGLAHKSITESLASSGAGAEQGSGRADGTAKDFGVALRIPVYGLVEGLQSSWGNRETQWRPRVDLQAGAAWFNRGDELVFIDADQADPLPEYRRVGWLGVFGISWVPHGVAWELGRLAGGTETYTPLVGGEEEPGSSDSMWGLEVSLFDLLDLRWGRMDDEDGNRHLDTSGITIRSDGVIRLAQILVSRTGQRSPVLDFIAEHLSISWTRFEEEGGTIFRKNSHTQIALSF